MSKNFLLGVTNGALFMGGDAFLGAATLLPIYLTQLTSSKVLIGFALACVGAGWNLPQFFIAYFARRLPRLMPLYRWASLLRFAAIAAFCALAWRPLLAPGAHGALSTVCLALFALAGGASGVAFVEMVGRTIPARLHGRFFGARLFFGGLLGLGAGAGVDRLFRILPVGGHPSPYAISFLTGAGLMGIAMLLFAFVDEPAAAPPEAERVPPASFRVYARESFRLFRAHPALGRFLLVWALLNAPILAAPFYITYLKDRYGIAEQLVGQLILAQTLGRILSNLVWGRLADRRGPLTLLPAYAALMAAPPALFLLAPAGLPIVVLAWAVFLALGFSESGGMISYMGFLLGMPRERDRLPVIGFMNSLNGVIHLLPLTGGWLIDRAGYPPVFALALAGSAAGLALSLTLLKSRRPD